MDPLPLIPPPKGRERFVEHAVWAVTIAGAGGLIVFQTLGAAIVMATATAAFAFILDEVIPWNS